MQQDGEIAFDDQKETSTCRSGMLKEMRSCFLLSPTQVCCVGLLRVDLFTTYGLTQANSTVQLVAVPHLCHVCTSLSAEGHQHGCEAGRQPRLQVALHIHLHSSTRY
jgi:hypothetical protein